MVKVWEFVLVRHSGTAKSTRKSVSFLLKVALNRKDLVSKSGTCKCKYVVLMWWIKYRKAVFKCTPCCV